jgi:hypothetical protein
MFHKPPGHDQSALAARERTQNEHGTRLRLLPPADQAEEEEGAHPAMCLVADPVFHDECWDEYWAEYDRKRALPKVLAKA